jgi:hypothetical protein
MLLIMLTVGRVIANTPHVIQADLTFGYHPVVPTPSPPLDLVVSRWLSHGSAFRGRSGIASSIGGGDVLGEDHAGGTERQ